VSKKKPTKKKATRKKAPAKKAAKTTVKKSPAKKKPPIALLFTKAEQTAAIVSQVLVHFGAGYGSADGLQIFAGPGDAKSFSDRLMKSTVKNLKELNWDADVATRDLICKTAFKHGGLAKKEAGEGELTWAIIERTLDEVKKDCPGGGGGGLVCVE
jgi:hypothetical protein